MPLPTFVNADGSMYKPTPHIPGYDLISSHILNSQDLARLRFVKREDHDPYTETAIPVDQDKIYALANELENAGLTAMAEGLRDGETTSLLEAFAVLEAQSVYGNYGKKIEKNVTSFADLTDFIDRDVLTGTCTVSAALAKMTIDLLLPDADAKIISGFKLRFGSVHLMGHAQVGFWHNGQYRVTSIAPFETIPLPKKENQQPEDTIPEVEHIELRDTLDLSIRSGAISLNNVLEKKYGPMKGTSKSLVAHLVKEPEPNFGRQVFKIFQTAYDSNKHDRQQISKIGDDAERLLTLLKQWEEFPNPSKRPKVFGQWSADEIKIFTGILTRLNHACANRLI